MWYCTICDWFIILIILFVQRNLAKHTHCTRHSVSLVRWSNDLLPRWKFYLHSKIFSPWRVLTKDLKNRPYHVIYVLWISLFKGNANLRWFKNRLYASRDLFFNFKKNTEVRGLLCAMRNNDKSISCRIPSLVREMYMNARVTLLFHH